MKILAIETSCDETAAAIVLDGTTILGQAVASSTSMHTKYGGIVPEIAAREQLTCILPTLEEALHQAGEKIETIDALAVTVGPGLIGSLLVGVETAKTMAFVKNKPLIPVNHVLAHMYANFIHSDEQNSLQGNPNNNSDTVVFPALSLVVSGGHTELFLMTSMSELQWLGGTLDDAAGECFDKSARLLGFENRGGAAIQEAAQKFIVHGSQMKATLPRPMLDKENEMNFSFSGLKTAILREVTSLKNDNQFNTQTIQQLAYEIQESITDVLVKKTLRAAEKYNTTSLLLSGGVAANVRLREKFIQSMNKQHGTMKFFVPHVSLCTDNAAYIASYAYFRGTPEDWHDVTAIPDLNVEV